MTTANEVKAEYAIQDKLGYLGLYRFTSALDAIHHMDNTNTLHAVYRVVRIADTTGIIHPQTDWLS